MKLLLSRFLAASVPFCVVVTASESQLYPGERHLFARDDCKTQTVVSGDSCGSLATKCGIAANDFTTYNPDPNLCSSLAVGQRVCCSSGSLPDLTPKQQADGTCANYTVRSGDTCSSIAAASSLKASDLATFNDGTTWGWVGCNGLMTGVNICLSKGTPPLPAPQKNAVCGPIKPGTTTPTDGQKIADLNPCPLNACCDVWGQCGITPEFCTNETAATGNPGTAPPGHNGCISNCGTKISSTGDAPSTFTRIGYYESWNGDRPCLTMHADSINTSAYTHVHWGFATISDSFDVSINDTFKQWSGFQSLTNIKKIVSFGGWGYSTDPATYDALRNAMTGSNVDTFITNIVNFMAKNGMDGVDFDWEYPGAPDIPGIPPGLKTDGPNYLSFLKALRAKLPSDKSISIAAPASFWYLRSFPIADMAKELDYIVYMTYDLHGQWDYGNSFSQDGCPAGSCLRSHVNLTETNYALAMITKAGVPTGKINVGISSYGRSFAMTQAGCIGPMCSFVGPQSAAAPGMCTKTAGYIANAEIDLILGANLTNARTFYDTDSNSDIMIYNDTQWVAFMSEDTRSSRTDYYKSLNFAGVVDWAIDLDQSVDEMMDDDDDDDDDDEFDGSQGPVPDIDLCEKTYNTVDDVANDNVPDNCKSYYLVMALSNMLANATKYYNDLIKDGYDDKFNTYSQAIVDDAGSTVRDFVNQNGNKYFSCIVAETVFCCGECQDQNVDDPCKYCFNDGACSQTCQDITGCDNVHRRGLLGAWNSGSVMGLEAGMMQRRESPSTSTVANLQVSNQSEPCPPDYSQRGPRSNTSYSQSVYWTLNADKSNAFYADLYDATGIAKDKIDFEDYNREHSCGPAANPGDMCYAIGYDYGMPTPVGFEAKDVTNPKSTVQKALDNSANLQGQISTALTLLHYDSYSGDPTELVDTISLPVLMICTAVDSMGSISTVADEITDEKRKAIILAFIGAVLFFVPVAGEVLGAVTELADVAAVISILGAVGNTAMDVYDIVSTKGNDPLAIFSLILEPLALGDLAKITKAANIRRGMSDAEVAKLGTSVSSRMSTIRKVTGTCRRV